MGKGDIKTRKGKISAGSFGVTRPRLTIKHTASKPVGEVPLA
jgi:ribosomal small subunit protein bTHX